MLSLEPTGRDEEPLHVLCLGAHADDIEIGCGGTVLDLVAHRPDTRIDWVVLSACEEREREARDSAERFLKGAAETQIVLGTCKSVPPRSK